MIITETTLTGTEEELLAYFKEKYNLTETGSANSTETLAPCKINKPAVVDQKNTTGIGNLFGGTSWGN
jgi:hypothetical protein